MRKPYPFIISFILFFNSKILYFTTFQTSFILSVSYLWATISRIPAIFLHGICEYLFLNSSLNVLTSSPILMIDIATAFFSKLLLLKVS
jgi:hypothetical protein